MYVCKMEPVDPAKTKFPFEILREFANIVGWPIEGDYDEGIVVSIPAEDSVCKTMDQQNVAIVYAYDPIEEEGHHIEIRYCDGDEE